MIFFIFLWNYYFMNYHFMELSFYDLLFLTTNNVKSIYVGASLPAPTIIWVYLFMDLFFYDLLYNYGARINLALPFL